MKNFIKCVLSGVLITVFVLFLIMLHDNYIWWYIALSVTMMLLNYINVFLTREKKKKFINKIMSSLGLW